MVFKNFRIGVILRAFSLGISVFISIHASYQNEWYLTTLVSSFFSIVFLIEIIRYAEKYKRSLSEFLISIKSRDFISSTNILPDKSTRDKLKESYQIILDEFKNIRIDKEIQYHYLKTIFEHIKTALLSFNQDGKIEFINKTAGKLFDLKANQELDKIKHINITLYNTILNLNSGESELIKLKLKDELLHLSIFATELKIQNKTIKLISLQNIKHELEFQELESWQKLIRVLTHEIMNSVTPISSLSSAINESLENLNGNQAEIANISDDDFQDMISSLKTIENRSKGLLRFVSSYKQLTRIPKPDFKQVNLFELVNHSKTLLKQKIKDKNIDFKITSDQKEVICYIDYDQIEQVIINLLINAIDAVSEKEKPEIKVNISQDQFNKCAIFISDNGKGIESEDIDKIFIPFYTTKKEGSGIGLSLSRQIMRLHKGTIQVNSVIDKGTEIILEF